MSDQIFDLIRSGMLAPACRPTDSRTGRGFSNANEAPATNSPPNAGGCGSAMATTGALLGVRSLGAVAGSSAVFRLAASVARCWTTETKLATVSCRAFTSSAMVGWTRLLGDGVGEAGSVVVTGGVSGAQRPVGDSEARRDGVRRCLLDGRRVGVDCVRLAADRLRVAAGLPRRFLAGGWSGMLKQINGQRQDRLFRPLMRVVHRKCEQDITYHLSKIDQER